MSQNYDLVITGGHVIDPETGLDAVRNVGIKGDKIAVVTKDKIQGKETIDAKGHVVCPGFIDMHHHNTGVPFGEKLALRDGVTTPMELEGGVYPVEGWYGSVEGKCRANYGASVGIVPIREHLFSPGYKTAFAGDWIYDMMYCGMTMKWSKQIATPKQIEQVEKHLEEGLRQGAIGVGHVPRLHGIRLHPGRVHHRPEARRKIRAGGIRPRPILESDAADQRHPRFP